MRRQPFARRALGALLVMAAALTAGRARADVPDPVWEALKERTVVVQKADGAELEGKLIGVAPTTIVVMKRDGEPVAVERSAIKSVRGSDAPRAPAPAAVVDDPRARPFERFGFVGGIVRPVFCMSRCRGSSFTAGAEIGYRVVAAAVRGGVAGDRGVIAADIRVFWDFRPIPRLVVTPLVEVSPTGKLGGKEPELDLGLRLGARVGYAISPSLTLWGELTTFDLHLVSTNGRVEDTDIYGRYAPAIGAQYRF